MWHLFDLIFGIPRPSVGVQCADQGITLNSKKLLLAEAGSASLTSVISLQLLCLALLCRTWHQKKISLWLKSCTDLFGMFLTVNQQKWKNNVAAPFCLSCFLQSRMWIEEQSRALSCFVPKAHLVQLDRWKIWYYSNQMDFIVIHEVSLLGCLLAISSHYSTNYFQLENEILKLHTEVGKPGCMRVSWQHSWAESGKQCWGSAVKGFSSDKCGGGTS